MTKKIQHKLVKAGGPRNPSLLSALFGDSTAPRVLHVTGDSTSNDPIDWAYKLGVLLAAHHPEYTYHYHLWNITEQRVGAAVQLQNGSAGNRMSTLGSTASARFNAMVDMTGLVDLDVRVKFAATDWTPTATAPFVGADASDPNRLFWLTLNSAGTIELAWFPLGTNASKVTATSTAATGVTDGQPKVIRATLDADNGASGYDVKFYTSATNGSWVQLGTTVTGGATTNLASIAAANLGVGARGTTFGAPGSYYWAEVRDSIDSVGVTALWDASDYDGADGTIGGVAGETWTPPGSPVTTGSFGFRVINASQAGQDSTEWATDPAFSLAHPVAPNVHLVNLGHNDGTATDITAYTALVDLLVTRWPNAVRGLVRQNDEPPSFATYAEHAIRQELIRALAISRRYELLDADAALRAYTAGDWTVDLMNDWSAGDVHPNAAGGTWLSEVFEGQFAAPRRFRGL